MRLASANAFTDTPCLAATPARVSPDCTTYDAADPPASRPVTAPVAATSRSSWPLRTTRGLERRVRVDGRAVAGVHLEVQVGHPTTGVAGVADPADHGAGADPPRSR